MSEGYSNEPMLDIYIFKTSQNIEQLEASILSSEKTSNYSQDAINEIFRIMHTIAKEAGSNAIGIILTGMGYDGARGLLSMKRKGARTIGQDEQSSVICGMPKVAFEIGAIEKKASLLNIPQVLISMLR